MEKQRVRNDPPNFAVLFAQVNAAGEVEAIEVAKQVAEQAETIRLISQAIEHRDIPLIVTYFSN